MFVVRWIGCRRNSHLKGEGLHSVFFCFLVCRSVYCCVAARLLLLLQLAAAVFVVSFAFFLLGGVLMIAFLRRSVDLRFLFVAVVWSVPQASRRSWT